MLHFPLLIFSFKCEFPSISLGKIFPVSPNLPLLSFVGLIDSISICINLVIIFLSPLIHLLIHSLRNNFLLDAEYPKLKKKHQSLRDSLEKRHG